MKVIRNDPPPSPPATFTLMGLTTEEASIIRYLLRSEGNMKTRYHDVKRLLHKQLVDANVPEWKS